MVVNVPIAPPPSKVTLPEISPPRVKVLAVVHCLASLIVPVISALLKVAVEFTVRVSPTAFPITVFPLTVKLPSVRILPSAEPIVTLVEVPSVIVKSSPAPAEPTMVIPALAVINPVAVIVEPNDAVLSTVNVPVISVFVPTHSDLVIETPPSVEMDAF